MARTVEEEIGFMFLLALWTLGLQGWTQNGLRLPDSLFHLVAMVSGLKRVVALKVL
jgi:hypothetical protein